MLALALRQAKSSALFRQVMRSAQWQVHAGLMAGRFAMAELNLR
jgi:hypothetical protein